MRKILIASTVIALAASASATTTLSQAWRIDGGTQSWFPATIASPVRTVRGADYYPAGDKVVVVSRSPGASLVAINALDGTGAVQTAFTASGGVFAANMVGVSGDNIIYVDNLKNAAGEPFKVYRFAGGPAATPTTAFDNADLGDAALVRVGDAFAVSGSGTGTELWAGSNATAGPHLVRFTTTDGEAFVVANRYTFSVGSFTAFGAPPPARLGLSVLGSGAGQQVWGDTSGGTDGPRRFNLATSVVDAEVPTSLNAYLGSATVVKAFELDGKVLLASGPGAYNAIAIPLVPLEASRGRLFDVTTPATPTEIAETTPLALQDSVPTFYPNADGTGAAFADTARRRVGFVLTNNSISTHDIPLPSSVTDWNLF